MLENLTIHNFALIRDINLQLPAGFIVLTGETGAGKSLLVSALTFLAGGTVSPGVVRVGENEAVVTGKFFTPEERIEIKRLLFSDGRIITEINGKRVNAQEAIHRLSPLLDITSQRSFNKLLNIDYHREYLDQFAQIGTLCQGMAQSAQRFYLWKRRVTRAKSLWKEAEKRREEALKVWEELNKINPQAGEDKLVAEELKRLEHIEELAQEGARLVEMIEGASGFLTRSYRQIGETEALIPQIKEVITILSRLAQHDSALGELIPETKSVLSHLSEVARQVKERCLKLEYSPQRLEYLRQRQLQLGSLVRKWGMGLDEILMRKDSLEKTISYADKAKEDWDTAEQELQKFLTQWRSLANQAHQVRKVKAVELEESVETLLRELGLPNAQFKVSLEKKPHPEGLWEENGERFVLTENGFDEVIFNFSANIGQPLRPLYEVASGGELSRILLCIKESLPKETDKATIVLDEIDVGVSGKVAHLVGRMLRSIGKRQQLIAITHLPQIASQADKHFRIIKRITKDETISDIEELTGSTRIFEIAQLLSAGQVTPEALSQAERLLVN